MYHLPNRTVTLKPVCKFKHNEKKYTLTCHKYEEENFVKLARANPPLKLKKGTGCVDIAVGLHCLCVLRSHVSPTGGKQPLPGKFICIYKILQRNKNMLCWFNVYLLSLKLKIDLASLVMEKWLLCLKTELFVWS